jgi:ribosome-binding protein aMBF1 (putative translation factor)
MTVRAKGYHSDASNRERSEASLHDPIEMTITPRQVSEARKLLGWSQAELALRARISQSSLARIERGVPASDKIGIQTRRAFEFSGAEFLEEHGATGVQEFGLESLK